MRITNFLHNFFNLDFHKLLMKCNTLETKKEVLENTIKDELYKAFMEKLGEPDTIKRLKEENKNLRLKIKEFRERELKNGIQRKNSKIAK